eukprot:Protomagalhaensia_sp_Gyna_25__5602@NODE_774_length_2646_cov_310_594553_g607_i0_p1_GENE_NODE_774_length_2646_cov_310_594553_g607_i0NODE_774_length_2646_cov_310_594553_g607_i0_p1_ORF_typecomplete_len519_score72_13NPL4/PF05021_15/2_5e51zfNPL4/PF05020_15/3_5e14UN_NPL4/PF11543_8/1_1e05ubiquitin/PF00240_23/0_024_NODE_774_length_2646_cov_310_594553_g607_i010882425
MDKGGNQLLFGDHKRLRDLRLASGVQLHLLCQTTPVMVSATPTPVARGLAGTGAAPPAKLPQVLDGGSSAVSRKSRKSNRTRTGTGGKSKHKFKPFESFLNETDFQISNLALGNDYRPVKKNASGATRLPPAISLKHQPYRHVDHLEVMNVAELSGFVAHWRNTLYMLQQRAAFLIGYYREDLHYDDRGTRAVVEAVYEPPQNSRADGVDLNDDPFLPTVERVAAALGLEVIGWCFTHLPRKKLITASEVMSMGRMQLRRIHKDKHYTGYPVSTFVTMTISPKEELRGEAGPDAFMISDLGLAMIRDDILSAAGTGEDEILLLRKPQKDELMPAILEEAQGVDKLDTDWLLIRVVDSAPREARSIFKRTTFPRMGRTEATFRDLRLFLSDAPAHLKPHERYADFHFILYVAKVLGVDSALAVCDAVVSKAPLDSAFEDLLKSLDS